MSDRADWERIVPVLSTAHIEPTTMEQLKTVSESTVTVAPYEYGDFVCVGVPLAEKELRELPKAMLIVLLWFVKNYPGQHWLAFDRDGDIISVLPTYDW